MRVQFPLILRVRHILCGFVHEPIGSFLIVCGWNEKVTASSNWRLRTGLDALTIRLCGLPMARSVMIAVVF
jgi:hypothetical protein